MDDHDRHEHVVVIQRWVRGWMARKRAARLAAISRQQKLQRRAQALQERLQISEQERKHLEDLDPHACICYWDKREGAALTIQRYFRGWCVRRRPDLTRVRRKRNQAAAVLQKHARGYLARKNRHSRGPAFISNASKPASPELYTSVLGVPVIDGQLQLSEEKRSELTIEALRDAKRFSKVAQERDPTPDQISALLEESQALSRGVVDALVAAAQTKDTTDHLLRTWEARHELPCDTDTLDPNMFPRLPPNTPREEAARLAHSQSLAEVVDIANMHEIEEQWWKVYVRNPVDAALVAPRLERKRWAHLEKVCTAHWELFEKSEALRLQCEGSGEDT